MNKIKVLIVDDHAVYRMGLIALLDTEPDIEVVGEAEDGKSALRKAAKLSPDVVVMDLMMPVMDGITATREFSQQQPSAKILILTTSTTSDDLANALKNGAAGAITKSDATSKLVSAIRTVAAGRESVSGEIKRLIADDPPIPELSPRQLEILQSITRGLTTPDIAKQLGISAESVKMHSSILFSKLGASNRTEAVAIALRKHLLKI